MLKVTVAMLALLVAACGTAEETTTTAVESPETTTTPVASPETTTTGAATATAPAAECAHVVDVTIEPGSNGFTVAATVASNDTGWEKYADAWQVLGPDGELLGERILTHPHENEQPFTRSLSGVQIPEGVTEVTVAARDLVLGFCGDVFSIEVPRP
jgi:hypothetical protein